MQKQPIRPAPVSGPEPDDVPGGGDRAGGPPPDPPFRGRNAGVGTGRPTEDAAVNNGRAGQKGHDDGTDGWNSNT